MHPGIAAAKAQLAETRALELLAELNPDRAEWLGKLTAGAAGLSFREPLPVFARHAEMIVALAEQVAELTARLEALEPKPRAAKKAA